MLNREKYAKEIVDAVVECGGQRIGIKDGKPIPCMKIPVCEMCDLQKECESNFIKWANSKYIEPIVNWDEVAVDTLILVKDAFHGEWCKRYFAKVNEYGVVYAWNEGKTSKTSEYNNDVSAWRYAKLADEEW